MSNTFQPKLVKHVPKIALVDADSIMYQLGWKFKAMAVLPNERDYSAGDIPMIVYREVNSYIEKLAEALNADQLELHFTASAKNQLVYESHYGDMQPQFRTVMGGEYKLNRKSAAPLPVGYHAVLRVLIEKYTCYMHDNIEADDAIVLLHKLYANRIISSNDKDVYNQIIGKNYCYDKRKKWTTTGAELANVFPYLQALAGDPVDGFYGVRGIGMAGAIKLVPDKGSPYEMWQAVLKGHSGNEAEAIWNMRCANMHQVSPTGDLHLFEPPTKDSEHIYPV